MIERSKERIVIPATATAGAGAGRGAAGRRANCVKCPVCSVLISVHDLEIDVVAVRRLRRAEERLRRAGEEEGGSEDGGEGEGGGDGEDVVDDDDGEEVVAGGVGRSGKGRRRADVKTEREGEESRELSVVPDTQMVDLG